MDQKVTFSMQMKFLSLFKYGRRILLILGSLYLVLWVVGFLRVWSFERELRREHRERGEAVEEFVGSLEPGDPAELVRNFQYARQGKTEFKYVIWYYDLIDEDSAVSNRGGPVYVVWVGTDDVTSIEKSWSLSHGDLFASPFTYYPSVALFGLDESEGF